MKMQHLILAAGIMLAAAGCGSSRNMSNDYSTGNAAIVVSPATQTAFVTRYPNATNVVWSTYDVNNIPIEWDLTDWPALTTNDYVVRYDMDNNNYYAWYDANGNWIGSTYAVSNYNSLPAAVNTMLSNNYPGYTISSVNNEYWKDRSAYQVVLTNSDMKVKLLVDANGNIIKQKTKAK